MDGRRNLDGAVGRGSIGRIGGSASGGLGHGAIGSLAQNLMSILRKTAPAVSKNSDFVDLGYVQPLEIEATGNMWPCASSQPETSSKTKLRDETDGKRRWSIEQLQAEVQSEAHLQTVRNAVMNAIEIGLARAFKTGSAGPPELEELTEDL